MKVRFLRYVSLDLQKEKEAAVEKKHNTESANIESERQQPKIRCVPPLPHDMKLDTYSDKIPINMMVWKCTRCSYQIIRQSDSAGRPFLHDVMPNTEESS